MLIRPVIPWLGIPILALAVAFGGAPRSAPQLRSYAQAVALVLDAYGVDWRGIDVTHGCAPHYQNCRTYQGHVQIDADPPLAGRIDCARRWTRCTLSVPDAGILRAPLRDVVYDDPLSTVAGWYEEAATWVHEQLAPESPAP
jgi:hypothetical protein